MTCPKLSVVMSVFNGEGSLEKTVNSVLSQTFSEFEFIIVNDGSNSRASNMLQELCKKDNRITILEHPKSANKGLTQSLILGCEFAQADFIARQDNGDISHPQRFAEQMKLFNANPALAMVSAGTQFLTPNEEFLYEVIQNKYDAQNGLSSKILKDIKGPPHHGSVMFRTDMYRQVGGYRSEFYVAQDLDLWMRLVELGTHQSLSEVLYTAYFEKTSISSQRRELQVQTTELIHLCAIERAEYGNDSRVLSKVKELSMCNVDKKMHIGFFQQAKTDSNYYYFLGSNLLNKNKKSAIRYFTLAIKSNPFTAKSYVKLAIALLLK